MAERNYKRGIYHGYDGLVLVAGKVALDGAGDPPAATTIPLVSSVTRTGVGKYRVLLQDTYKGLHLAMAQIVKSGGIVEKVAVDAEDVDSAATPYVDFLYSKVAPAAPDLAVYGVEGGVISGPTTPSTQATDAGNTDWNIDHAAIYATMGEGGTIYADYVAAQADYDLHSGSNLLADGEQCVAALVVKVEAGVITVDHVLGTIAATGAATAPTDGDITTDLGHANWIRLGEVSIDYATLGTINESFDDGKREVVKVVPDAPAVSAVAASTPLTATLEFMLLLDNSAL